MTEEDATDRQSLLRWWGAGGARLPAERAPRHLRQLRILNRIQRPRAWRPLRRACKRRVRQAVRFAPLLTVRAALRSPQR